MSMSTNVPYRPRKNGWVVLILNALFGWLGVHRFYLGHIGMGILYLLTGGFLLIGVIIDVFRAFSLARMENVRRGYGYVDY